MKRMITLSLISGLLLVWTTGAVGFEDREQLCRGIADLAAGFMSARQSGVSMSTALEIARATDAEAPVENLAVKMVIEAYRQPMFHTVKFRERAVQRFWETWFVACMDVENQ